MMLGDEVDKALGRTIRYYRLTLGHTMRSVAKLCPFSHTFLGTIEKGYPDLSESHLSAIKALFKTRMTYEKAPFDRFLVHEENALNAWVFNQDDALLKQLDGLKRDHQLYLDSAYAFDYYFLTKSLCILLRRKPFNYTQQEINIFDQIEPLMRPYQKSLYQLVKSYYLVRQGDLVAAVRLLERSLEKDVHGLLNGIIYQTLSQFYMFTFYQNKAHDYQSLARQHYEQTNNYRRLQEAQLTIPLLNIKRTQTLETFDYSSLMHECHIMGFEHLRHHYEVIVAQTMIINHMYEEASAWLGALKETSIRLEFIELYLAYLQQRPLSSKNQKHLSPLIQFAYKAFKLPSDEPNLKRFYEMTLSAYQRFENTIAYHLLMAYLSKRRRYKEALILTEKRLEFILEGL